MRRRLEKRPDNNGATFARASSIAAQAPCKRAPAATAAFRSGPALRARRVLKPLAAFRLRTAGFGPRVARVADRL